MELAELATVATVVHYVEAVMTRYNVIRMDAHLDDEEVDRALPVFAGLIDSIIPKPWWLPKAVHKSIAEHGFKFVLKHGELPTTKTEYAYILDHIGRSWDLNMDRMGLTKVFSTLIREISAQSAKSHKSCN